MSRVMIRDLHREPHKSPAPFLLCASADWARRVLDIQFLLAGIDVSVLKYLRSRLHFPWVGIGPAADWLGSTNTPGRFGRLPHYRVSRKSPDSSYLSPEAIASSTAGMASFKKSWILSAPSPTAAHMGAYSRRT